MEEPTLPPLPDELPPLVQAPTIEKPEPTAGRLVRLRARLSRSQNVFGKGLLSVLSRDHLDEDTWEEIEDTLLTADIGVGPTQELVDRLRTRLRVEGPDAGDPRPDNARSPANPRATAEEFTRRSRREVRKRFSC